MNIAVSAKNLSKNYRMYKHPSDRMKELLHPFGKRYSDDFCALKDISFEVGRGDSLGIIGKNGSGKSTLLQLLCKILQPTNGEVNMNGRVTALLELGAGFNPEFTGRENVYLNGALMGYNRQEMDERFEAIAEFADIGEFIERPAKTYSSGMYVRLAFSCAVNVEPDILIVDEALSVGDIFFQQKCYARIREIISKGTTCLFVSHDTAAVQNICDRVLLLEYGQQVFLGDTEEGVSRYFAGLDGKSAKKSVDTTTKTAEPAPAAGDDELMSPDEIVAHNILGSAKSRHGGGELEVVATRVTDKAGKDTMQVEMMETLTFHMLLKAKEHIESPTAYIQLYDRLGNVVFASGCGSLKHNLPSLSPDQRVVVRFDLSLTVSPGEYAFTLGSGESYIEGGLSTGSFFDTHEGLGPITIYSDPGERPPFYGIAKLPMKVKHTLAGKGAKNKADEKSVVPAEIESLKTDVERTIQHPSFFIVGAAKAGTTSLWDYLGQHTQIFMTKEIQFKELGYYCNSYGVSDLHAYLDHFKRAKEGQLVGEACTAYLSSPESAALIKENAPEAKIIIMLRDPAKRAYSLYNWMSSEGYEPADTFEQALEFERELLKRCDINKIDTKDIGYNIQTYCRDYLYINSGMYYEQVERYLKTFGKENCLVMLLEDLKEDPSAVLKNVFDFLGVDSTFRPELGIKNKGNSANSIKLQFYLRQEFLDQLAPLGISRLDAVKLQSKLMELNSNPVIPPIKEETMLILRKMYREDILKIAELIERDLSAWLE